MDLELTPAALLVGVGKVHLGDQIFALSRGTYVNFPPRQTIHFVSSESDSVLHHILRGGRQVKDGIG